MTYIEELNKHTYHYGIKGLLPQYLTDSILDWMLMEMKSSYTNNTLPDSALLKVILSIENGNTIKDDIDILDIDFDSTVDLMNKFNSYQECVQLEVMRRGAQIFIGNNSLPTLKNIFNDKRKKEIYRLN